ncbi:ESPR-type extended signal peptide-containing protein [Allisonella histaminiformans]|uniref:ESPR-type extended signal peptide-containing protein n=1 Tax=Allisonella histaminiformans TaxID=209880 RepID=UPI002E7A6B03|nr:ESPR-type extended signal peptide-containing protein [Allisonella histaminiformans]
MNHIYKVIWNKAKHCYTVVSEIAKSHSQSNKRVRSMTAVVAAAMMLTGFGGMAIEAANPASGDTNITIGKGASVSIWNGVTGHDGVTSGYISIGENAFAWDGEHTYKDKYARIGTKEYLLDFNQGAVVGAESFFGVPYKYRVTDGTKLAGAIAIGKNTMARTGSVMIGDHTYKGQLGDIEVDPSNKQTLNNGVYSTTLGTSSYNSGSMATVTGALSIASGNKYTNDTQNFGATIYGSLNSIESSTTSDSASGMANSVLGFGNRTQNANASLVWGTGNEVTNSIEDVTFSTNWNKTSASDAQKEIIKAMQDQFAGGSVMAIGGGNKADWATYSQLLGVQNTLTGTEKDVSKLTLINGYKNTVTNAQNTTIIGSNNTATNIKSTIVMGDHNTLEGRKNVISLGNNNTVDANDAVAIGNGTTVKAESGVAIGVDSVADRVADSEKGKLGAFAPDTIPTGEESTWASTRGAVSVGDTANNITRQITNVAAGNEDTDAVNVAQLKQVASQAERANQGWNLTTNGVAAAATNVAPGGSVDFSGDDNITVSNQDTKVKVSLNKDINVNSVQTNALNSKYNLSVGTAAADGKMPFFVNSTGDFYAAGGEFVVDKDGSVKATSGDIGNVKLNNGVFYKNSALRDGELYVGDADGNYSQITSKNAKLGKVTIDDTGRISGVAAGRIAADSTDAINGSQLHAVQQEAGKHTKVVNGSNITVEETDQDGQKTYKVGLNKDINVNSVQTNALNSKYNLSVGTAAADGKMPFFVNSTGDFYAAGGEFVVDKDGSVKATSGDIGNVKLNNGVFYKNSALRDGELYVGDADGNYSQITSKNAKLGKVTIDDTGRISGVAAGRIAADSTDAINGSQLYAVQQEAGKHTKVVNGSNITVEETDQDGQKTYKVGLNKDLLLGDITGKNVSISGTNGTIETTGFIATKDKIYADKGAKLADVNVTGDTISNDKSSVKLDKDGTVTINNKVTVDQNGKVSGVAAGDISATSTDAVNGSQLFATNQQVVQNAQSISKLGNRINKVGAGAAALAALHPLDFDPDDKWDFAAGYGNYNGENAVAIGAYYRPNEDTMFSVGGSFGNGENMVNAGVSLKLGQGNHVSTSKVAMAKEIKDLRKELEGLKSALLDVNAGKKLDTSKLQLFPDVPKNHWAYEYVSTLKGNGMLTGYPDGEFKGDRPMTRYEFATMLYKAMLEGATLSDKILKEFAPELERFTVDTVHQDKDGKPTVERVRMVKAAK